MPRKKNNTTLVREYIRGLIVRQGVKAGDMLPCEGDIAAALEISKSCVREATHALESIGLIEIRHGIGLVLRDFNLDAIGDIFDYSFVLDLSLIHISTCICWETVHKNPYYKQYTSFWFQPPPFTVL